MRVSSIPMILGLSLLLGCADEATKKKDSAGWHGEELPDEDDTSAPACTDYEMLMLEAEAMFPSVIRIFFKLTCDDNAVPDMNDEDFTVLEDGSDISIFESSQQIVPTVAGYELSTLLLLDMSGSMVDAGLVDELQEAATAFIERLGSEHEIAIYSFDGREDIQRLVPFTRNPDLLSMGLATLSSYETVDSSTNLNGAILRGLEAVDEQKLTHEDKLFGGTMAVFTDGKDQAGRVPDSTAKIRAEATEHSIYTIGLGAEIDEVHLSDVGRDGAYFAEDVTGLTGVFDDVAESILNEANSLYILAYCSPKRAGVHELELRLTGTDVSIGRSFNADGFEGGCDPTDFVPAEFLDLDEDGYRPYDGDCNDEDATINPTQEEVCDGIDNDCDGQVDDGVSVTMYVDADDDGYGNPDDSRQVCEEEAGLVTNDSDCNDDDVLINPEAAERCNAVDDDCDGDVDEADEGDEPLFYRDADGDGYGVEGDTVVGGMCDSIEGYATVAGDCDDTSASVYPGGFERCNEQDDDCDGETDEDPIDGMVLYLDEDGDGVGDVSESMESCTEVDGWVLSSIGRSCKALLDAGLSDGDGIYEIDPDGGGAFDVWCDMSDGGWTLLARYERNIRLDFDPNLDQVQGHGTVEAPPPLQATVGRGHIAFGRFNPEGQTVKIDCGSDGLVSHSVSHDDLFMDWEEGDRGTVGDTEGWGVLRWNSVREGHYACGSEVVESEVQAAFGYCSGTGSTGSWGSHEASITFSSTVASANVVGCDGGVGEWIRVWLGPTE